MDGRRYDIIQSNFTTFQPFGYGAVPSIFAVRPLLFLGGHLEYFPKSSPPTWWSFNFPPVQVMGCLSVCVRAQFRFCVSLMTSRDAIKFCGNMDESAENRGWLHPIMARSWRPYPTPDFHLRNSLNSSGPGSVRLWVRKCKPPLSVNNKLKCYWNAIYGAGLKPRA